MMRVVVLSDSGDIL